MTIFSVNLKRLLIIFFALGCAGTSIRAGAETPSIAIRRHLNQAAIAIGERVTYTLKVSYSPGYKVILPQPGTGLESFEVKDFNVEKPRSTREGLLEEIQTIELTTFTAGEYVIPELTLPYLDEQGQQQTISSEKLFLKVTSVGKSESDQEDIRPNKPQQDSPPSDLPYYLGGLVLALIFMALITLYYLKKRKTVLRNAIEVQLPPYEWACQRLEWIRKQGYPAQNQHKEYYDALSDCVREYLMRLFGLPLLDRTTTETYAILREFRPLRNHLSQINDFLKESDLVKFARFVPEGTQEDDYWRVATVIIEDLRPTLQPGEEETRR